MALRSKTMKFYGIGVLWLALCGCSNPTPQDSSSSHWLDCKHDQECLGVAEGAGCSNRTCVNAGGERLRVVDADGDLDTRGDERVDVQCDVLRPVQQAGDSASKIRIEHHAQTEAGEHILLVVPERSVEDSDYRLFYGESDAMVERRISKMVREPGRATVDFLIDGETISALFRWRQEVNLSSEEKWIVPDDATLTGGDGITDLRLLPTTAAALKELQLNCFGQLPNSWEPAASEPSPVDGGSDTTIGDGVTVCPTPLTLNMGVGVWQGTSDDIRTIAGLVTDAGTGYPAREGSPATEAEDVSYFVLRDDEGEEHVVVVTARGFDPRHLLARNVELEVEQKWTGWGGSMLRFMLRGTGVETPVLFWLGKGYTLEALLSPLPLTEGRAECEMADGCFPSWQSHSLDVDPREPGGEHVQVPYGQQVNTRNWVISNGALERQSSEIRYCSDVVVNKAEVAIWPQPFETCVPLATDNCQICEPTFDEAVNAVEQICSDAQETQTEVEVSGFAARNCGLQIVMVSTGAGSPTYAFYDLQTNELVGWSNLNQPEACSGLVPADVTCYEDANFSQVTDLCPPTETETADAGVEE